MRGLGVAVAWFLLLWLGLLLRRLHWRPVGLILFVPKLFAQALTPILGLVAAITAAIGVAIGSWWMAGVAGAATLVAIVAIVRVSTAPVDLTDALGSGWQWRIPALRRAHMIGRVWTGPLRQRASAPTQVDVPIARIPGTDRDLLCDVWRPPAHVPASGVAVVFLHNSAWTILDKDAGTRPLFTHLSQQGHVIVDVAYRLFPEGRIPDMVADARRAVGWVRDHAAELDVDPAQVVLMGASAGGHLALLTAYTTGDPDLVPQELRGTDLGVAAVVALYAPTDLATMYEFTDQASSTSPDDPQPDWEAPPDRMTRMLFGDDAERFHGQAMMVAGRFDWLIGGTPDDDRERYMRLSPLHRVHPACPTTLLLHGTQDQMAPIETTQQMESRLRTAGVPVSAVYLPHTDHAFDVLVPRWSPPARVAIHVLERFLAGIATARPHARAATNGRVRQPLAGNPARGRRL